MSGPAAKDDGYEWQPFTIADGTVHIPDLAEFYDTHDILATCFIAGDLFVLRKGTYDWVNITEFAPIDTPKTKPGGNVRPIR